MGNGGRETNRPGRARNWRPLAGEAVVPLCMLGFLAAYWWQAAGLSVQAVSFPLALSGVLVVLLAAQAVLVLRAFRRDDTAGLKDGPDDGEVAVASGSSSAGRRRITLAARRLGMLGLAAGLFLFWRELGGTLVIWMFSLGTLLMLGERRWTVLIPLPLALAVLLTFLFKAVLSVRVPDGLIPLF